MSVSQNLRPNTVIRRSDPTPVNSNPTMHSSFRPLINFTFGRIEDGRVGLTFHTQLRMVEDNDNQFQAFISMLWEAIEQHAGLPRVPVTADGTRLSGVAEVWICDNNHSVMGNDTGAGLTRTKTEDSLAGLRRLRAHLQDATFSHLVVDYGYLVR
ncbi:hypothetical protein GLAREA_03471 [Glarea lozoyensis ATCC 20868]|uniref:Uncharacterized protein n=1 Tax=Glarea lozoyensis (strain ATCC 20868 / MF5171) TaxID=1116229 RepID=S3D017_GLAL2|nr:uncharacterized protein GLAREA_03471 [Glarea lozoyensis ATCC 20868]EPE30504.1 hypothetical protein GLAREA_03471 [Glarea lozoyensis ATCC 20868]